MDTFLELVSSLHASSVRFVVIGVWGANYYAHSAGLAFSTQDHDLFLPADAENLVLAWRAAESLDLELTCFGERLDSPRDLLLAQRVLQRRALTRVHGGESFLADYTLVMAGFEFDSVWVERRTFRDQGQKVPVASLRQIIQSKANVGRPKDRLFLETHGEALRNLLPKEDRRGKESS